AHPQAGIRELALFLLDNCSAARPVPHSRRRSGKIPPAIIYLGESRRNKNYRKIFGTRKRRSVLQRPAPNGVPGAAPALGRPWQRGQGGFPSAAGPQANGKCLVCAQSRENYAYSETRRARVRTLRRPSVWLSVNRTKLNPSDALQVRQNDSLTVSCNVAGNGTLSARLLRDGVTNSSQVPTETWEPVDSHRKMEWSLWLLLDRKNMGAAAVLREGQKEARLELAKAQPSDSGFYRCEGSSNLEPLRQRNLHFAATNCSLLVK
uniref:Ig-like domain-containing protein n=1 Tax=Macrostomum lignano TaxID=282301 RepID=A0A1I8FHG3_9PLAT